MVIANLRSHGRTVEHEAEAEWPPEHGEHAPEKMNSGDHRPGRRHPASAYCALLLL